MAVEAAGQDPAWIERELARILEESDLAPLRDIVQDVEDFTAQAQEETLDSEKNADEAAIASEADAGADRDAEGDGDDGEEVQQGELVSEDPDSVALAVGLRDVGGWRFVRAEDALMREIGRIHKISGCMRATCRAHPNCKIMVNLSTTVVSATGERMRVARTELEAAALMIRWFASGHTGGCDESEHWRLGERAKEEWRAGLQARALVAA